MKDGDQEITTYTVKYVGVDPTVYAESENPPTGAGSYKAVVTLGGNYSGTLDVNFSIAKADPDKVDPASLTPAYTEPSGLTATYGQRLSDVELPEGWKWDEPDALVGDVGSNSFSATFTPNDTANYNTVSKTLTITVTADGRDLQQVIEDAKQYRDSIQGKHSAIAAELTAAIQEAEGVAANNPTQPQVEEAKNKLNQAVAKAKDKVSFAEYQPEQKAVADALAQEGDSDECKKLIADAKAAIDALTYDETKTLAENKALVDAIIKKLKADLENQRIKDGTLNCKVETKDGAPETSSPNLAEVTKILIDAIINGELEGISDEVRQAVSQPDANITVVLVCSPLPEDQIPAEDKAALDKEVQDAGYTGALPFDLSLLLKVNGQTVAEIHTTKTAVKFSIKIPEELMKALREYFLVKVHEGKATTIATQRNGDFLEGESDEFSTYAIAYKDTEEQPKPVPSKFYFKKVWEGSTEKSIDFTLYRADGKVIHQGFEKHILNAKEWSYSAVFTGAGSCYVVEKPIPGYITRYVNVGEYAGITDRCCNGGTIINKKIPKTGDETPLLLWAGMLLTGAAGLTVALTVNKRRKAHK